MATDHEIPELDRKGLREFGLTTGAIVAILFGLFFPWFLGREWPVWPWIISVPLWGLAIAVPTWLRPVYYVWMRAGLLISRVTTPLMLGIVFFAVISPIALIRRLRRRDPMFRSFDPNADTYRVSSQRNSVDRLERPF
jgi:hypothetical protein